MAVEGMGCCAHRDVPSAKSSGAGSSAGDISKASSDQPQLYVAQSSH